MRDDYISKVQVRTIMEQLLKVIKEGDSKFYLSNIATDYDKSGPGGKQILSVDNIYKHKELIKANPHFSYFDGGSNPITIKYENNRMGPRLKIVMYYKDGIYHHSNTFIYHMSEYPMLRPFDYNMRAFKKIHLQLMNRKLNQELEKQNIDIDGLINKTFPHMVDDILLKD